MPRIQDLPTREERRDATEKARREARFVHAKERIRRIANAEPAFDDEQNADLAAILTTARRPVEAA